MSKLSTGIAFLFGAAIGGTAVWFYTKEKYAKIAEEEIDSVKEAYAKREQKLAHENDVEPDTKEAEPPQAQTVLTNNKVQEKGDIADYARSQGVDKYTQYSHIPHQETKPKEDEPKAQSVEAPYVIEPEEFGEMDGYNQVSLLYFEDGVLADEHGVIIDDIEEIVGDALNHFGEYEDDSVFCRSDPRKCDYEILKELRTYDEFLKTLPPKI